MKLKSIMAIIIVLSCFTTSSFQASASAGKNPNDYGVSLLDFCIEDGCSSMLPIVTICNLDRKYGGSHTHKCGFLWKDTCTIKGYYATETDVCPGCGHCSAPYGQHYCLEEHDTCGAGDNGKYNVCPFGGEL